MAYRTAKASDYQQLLLEQTNQNQSVQNWYNLFVSPFATQLGAEIESTQQQASYDISSAYNTFRQQQRMAAANPQIATSVRERAQTGLQRSYAQQYQSIRGQEASDIGNLQQTYGTEIAKQYQTTSENLARLDEALMEYGKTKYGADMKWYDTMYNKDDGYTLTESGKQVYDELLNKVWEGGDMFKTYLRYTLKDTKLADFYEQNVSLVNTLAGGLEEGDFEFSSDDSRRAAADRAYQSAKSLLGEDLEEREFESFAEKEQYYNEAIARRQDEQLRASKDTSYQGAGTNYEAGNSHIAAKITLNNKKYKIDKLYYNWSLKKILPIENYAKEKFNSGTLARGDVFKYNGMLFYIDSSYGKGNNILIHKLM